MSNQLVSVIIPVYNSEKYLERCVNSVIEQSYRYLEIILIDDGSTDSSIDICRKYQSIDSRVRVLKKENEGVSKARNIGINLARGDFICFVDSDDYIVSTMIMNMLAAMENNSADLVVCSFYDVTDKGIQRNVKAKEGICKGAEIDQWLLSDPFSYYTGVLWNKLYKRKLINSKKLQFKEGTHLGEDFIFNLQYLVECKRVIFVPEYLYYYNQTNEESLTRNQKLLSIRIEERNVLFSYYKQYFIEKQINKKYSKEINRYIEQYTVAEAITILLGKDKSMKQNKHGKVKMRERIHGVNQLYKSCLKKNHIPFNRYLFFFSLKSCRYEITMHLKQTYPILGTMRLRELTPIRMLNIIYRIKIVPFLKKHRASRKILLYCDSTTMEEHLLDYYQNTKDLPNLEFYLLFEGKTYTNELIQKRKNEMLASTNIKAVNSKWEVKWKPWDLVVCADTFLPEWINKYCVPTLYVNHGLHIISFNGGFDLYAYSWATYGNGESKFTKMLEPNKRFVNLILKDNVKFKNVIEPVGWKYADTIINESRRSKEYREKLGVNESEVLVAVFGTWNKDSLFHTVGRTIINQAKELMPKGYRFILSIHPREYTNYDENIVPMGQYVEQQRKAGFIIRNPKESYLPYLIAADVVISDYSTMYELALIANKPLVLTTFSNERVWRYSIAKELKKTIPIFTNKSNLQECILRSIGEPELREVYKKYQKEITQPCGEYRRRVRSITEDLLNRRPCREKS